MINMTDQQQRRPPQRQHHQPRRHGSNNNPNQQHQGQGQRNQSNNRRPYRGRYRRPSNRTLNSNQVLLKYDNLLEQHLKSRKRYFEYYNRVDDHQRRKLELQFFSTIEHLRRFEASLEDWQKDYLKKKTERYRLDLTYSQNHELPAVAEPVSTDGEFPDPHFTSAMTKAWAEYAQDTEESVGSIEDYQKYKDSK
jgi:hypothetical protein